LLSRAASGREKVCDKNSEDLKNSYAPLAPNAFFPYTVAEEVGRKSVKTIFIAPAVMAIIGINIAGGKESEKFVGKVPNVK
jgi:hypothetical protein